MELCNLCYSLQSTATHNGTDKAVSQTEPNYTVWHDSWHLQAVFCRPSGQH